MYSYDEKIKAISVLKNVGFNYKEAVNILGYPNSGVLRKWAKEYKEKGDFLKETKSIFYFSKDKEYSIDEKKRAVAFYLENGKNISRTIRCLGYPTRFLLKAWINIYAPGQKRPYVGKTVPSKAQKIDNLLAYLKTHEDIITNAYELNKNESLLYNTLIVLKKLLNKDIDMKKKGLTEDDYYELLHKFNDAKREIELLKKCIESPESYKQTVDELEKKNKELQLELDIIMATESKLKKERGIDYKKLSNKEKAMLINALASNYAKSLLFNKLALKKRTYYNIVNNLGKDKYLNTRVEIRNIFYSSNKTYGYRRIHDALLLEKNIKLNEKTIRKIAREEKLNVIYFKPRKKYSSYRGEKGFAPENIVNRNFHTNKPNQIWLTDITEFNLNDKKIYLSPIIDCFDGKVVSFSISTSPNHYLANSSLLKACKILKEGEHPIIHSDRGVHYQWKDWKDICDKYNLTRSMSKKGCCADNSACEGFFGRLKNEFFYNRKINGISVEEFTKNLTDYIKWYNEGRRKSSLKGLTILEYRKKLNLAS